MSMQPKFRSSTTQPVSICTTSGQGAHVTREWRTLPEFLHAAAVAAGCECSTMAVERPTIKAGPNAMQQSGGTAQDIRKALQTMLERDRPGDFTRGNGDPNQAVVAKLVGFVPNKTEVLDVWREMKAEIEQEEEEPAKATG